jgi:hypothetical protein
MKDDANQTKTRTYQATLTKQHTYSKSKIKMKMALKAVISDLILTSKIEQKTKSKNEFSKI